MSAQRPPERTLPHGAGAAAASVGPILAPGGASAAMASRPDQPLDGGSYHIYEGHPAPWWVAALWVAFFVFAVAYLITNLLD